MLVKVVSFISCCHIFDFKFVVLILFKGVDSHRGSAGFGAPFYSHQGLPGDVLSQPPSTAGSIEHPALDLGSVEGNQALCWDGQGSCGVGGNRKFPWITFDKAVPQGTLT